MTKLEQAEAARQAWAIRAAEESARADAAEAALDEARREGEQSAKGSLKEQLSTEQGRTTFAIMLGWPLPEEVLARERAAEKRGAERERWECHRIAAETPDECGEYWRSCKRCGAHIADAISARGPMRGPEEEWMSLYDDLVRENADLRKSQAANEAELRRADETIGALRKRASEAELERDSMLSACVSACVSAGWYAEGGDPEGFILALRKRVEELEVSAGSAAMTIRMAQARAEKAEQRVEELEQTSFDLCPNCGWRTAGPDGCFKERAEKAERELGAYKHEAALLDALTQRGVTDCSTPRPERVQNIVAALEKAERERDAQAQYIAGCDAAMESLQADLDTTKNELSEAQAALWRVIPNTITVEGGGVDKGWPGADPFEGPGETYQAAYERVKADLDAALDWIEKEEPVATFPEDRKILALLEKRRRRG